LKAQIRYLLVTHIPFARNGGGVELDALWLRDLEGLRDSMGRVTIAAPQVPAAELHGWGPNVASVQSGAGLEFVGFASIRGRRDLPRWLGVRRILHDAVAQADLVHTTNFFPPYLRLAYAHETAVKLGKKTLFVIAEDFIDMLGWEWNRLAAGGFQRWRRPAVANHGPARAPQRGQRFADLHAHPGHRPPLPDGGAQLDRD
jgi:hypothetical protein